MNTIETEAKTKNIIMVLGAGRSGTSLLMQVLLALGLQRSKEYVQANSANPEGFFEDTEIARIHGELLRSLRINAYLPMPDNWMEHAQIPNIIHKLKELIVRNTDNHKQIWGFKDPRTSQFLPLWSKVLNQARVVGKPVICIRNPSDTFISFLKQFNEDPRLIELVWLSRNIEAIDHFNASCFIVHYENWFSNPNKITEDLLRYTGLKQVFDKNTSQIINKIIKNKLNRSCFDEHKIRNPYVSKLYNVLIQCHGKDFDRQLLMNTVMECRYVMDGFKGWYQIAHEKNKKLTDLQDLFQKVSSDASKVKDLNLRIRKLEIDNILKDQLSAQIQKLERQLTHLWSL